MKSIDNPWICSSFLLLLLLLLVAYFLGGCLVWRERIMENVNPKEKERKVENERKCGEIMVV
uniref:Uncharacterized protein n=1 Tax=Rhizophora mucronata TaxID=61149 RepID=A0A2P2JDH9_RHIMU